MQEQVSEASHRLGAFGTSAFPPFPDRMHAKWLAASQQAVPGLAHRPLYRFLRRIFLRLPRPLLTVLFGWYYALGMKVLVKWLQRKRSVTAIVLVGSGAYGQVVPGVSDIDYYVILSPLGSPERCRTEVRNECLFLHRLFPFLGLKGELSILTVDEWNHLLKHHAPWLFSAKGASRVLWARTALEFTMPYQIEHGWEQLGAIWSRFLSLVHAYRHDPLYSRHIQSRLINDFAQYCSQTGLNGPAFDAAPPRSAEDIWRRFTALVETTFTMIGGTPRHPIDARQPFIGTVPNVTPFETHLIWELLGAAPAVNTVRIRVVPDLASLSFADVTEVIESGTVDFLGTPHFVFPLRKELGRYLPQELTNPLFFEALRGCAASKETPSPAARFAALVNDPPPNAASMPAAPGNLFTVSQLVNDRDFLSRVPPLHLPFIVGVIAYWKRVQTRSSESSENDARLSRLVREVSALAARNRHTEAYFLACQLLYDRPEPRRLTSAVLIPTRNRASLLRRTLEAIEQQTRLPDSVIVVDNGSTDATAALLEEFSHRLAQLRSVHEPRLGIPQARNRALSEVPRDIDVVLFIDDDCVPPNHWMEEMMLPFEYDPDIVSVGGGFRFSAEDQSFWGEFYQITRDRMERAV